MNGHKTSHPRGAVSRLAAVQALYEIERGSPVVEAALEHVFENGAIINETDGHAKINEDLTERIVRGVAVRADALDNMIGLALDRGRTTGRLETLIRAMLRAGTFELLEHADQPARVVINDYVIVADAFYDRAEPGLVNAVLNKIAHEVRASEFEPVASTNG